VCRYHYLSDGIRKFFRIGLLQNVAIVIMEAKTDSTMTHENKDYIEALRSKGYRVTPQRLIVLDAVCASQGHATIADIHATVNHMDNTIDRSTIYRALDVLRDSGLIVESEIEGTGKVYRIAGESDHHHLVCSHCGKILTIQQDSIVPLFFHFQQEFGFQVQTDHLVFNGLCKDCQT